MSRNFRAQLVQTGSIAKTCRRLTGENVTNADVYRVARNLGLEAVTFDPNTKGFNNLHAQLLRDAIVENIDRVRADKKAAEVAAAQAAVQQQHTPAAEDGITHSGELAVFTDWELKEELKRRGWSVTCTREVKTIETL